MRSFCRKTHVHKIPRFRGGGFGGGGSADFIFMGTRIFLIFFEGPANFCGLSYHMSQEPSKNCSEKLIHVNISVLGGICGVDHQSFNRKSR